MFRGSERVDIPKFGNVSAVMMATAIAYIPKEVRWYSKALCLQGRVSISKYKLSIQKWNRLYNSLVQQVHKNTKKQALVKRLETIFFRNKQSVESISISTRFNTTEIYTGRPSPGAD